MPRRDVSIKAGLAIALTLMVAGPLSAQREQGWAVRESLEKSLIVLGDYLRHRKKIPRMEIVRMGFCE